VEDVHFLVVGIFLLSDPPLWSRSAACGAKISVATVGNPYEKAGAESIFREP
jgi:hypothetical protein